VENAWTYEIFNNRGCGIALRDVECLEVLASRLTVLRLEKQFQNFQLLQSLKESVSSI